MRAFRNLALAAVVAGAMTAGSAQALTLGAFTFNDSEFGNTLLQSDGGSFAASNWLNVVDADPGSPGYLTGADVDTGIANIGLSGPVSYTIGYSGGIANGSGDDLGIITARYSSDPITVEFSLDGSTFTAPVVLAAADAVSTGVGRTYFYGGTGPFGATLFVTPVDLSDFGIAPGASIVAARITGTTELDLIRVAGFGAGGVPEPASWALMLAGFTLAGGMMRAARRRAVTA